MNCGICTATKMNKLQPHETNCVKHHEFHKHNGRCKKPKTKECILCEPILTTFKSIQCHIVQDAFPGDKTIKRKAMKSLPQKSEWLLTLRKKWIVTMEEQRCFWSVGNVMLCFFFTEVVITPFDFKLFFKQYIYVLCILLHECCIMLFLKIPHQRKKMPISQ